MESLGENVHKISLVIRESLVLNEGIICYLVNIESSHINCHVEWINPRLTIVIG